MIFAEDIVRNTLPNNNLMTAIPTTNKDNPYSALLSVASHCCDK